MQIRVADFQWFATRLAFVRREAELQSEIRVVRDPNRHRTS